jgi:apolipoprotein D and lipocalin family protein
MVIGRSSSIDEATEAAYRAEATRQGFDLTRWITPTQTGRRVTDDLL